MYMGGGVECKFSVQLRPKLNNTDTDSNTDTVSCSGPGDGCSLDNWINHTI